ncbi:MAG TPA: hypothetical protein PLS49_01530 [Candidatus Woesebacteria bacterium]|nr:hypothetical protein [Candidatus Woesebacteria bacterium]
MKNFFRAFKLIYKEKRFKLITLLVFAAVIVLYFMAIELSVSFDMFIKVNSKIFIVFQLVLSLLNALFAAFAITFTLFIFRLQKVTGGLGSVQAIASLVVAIGTTGCYVCGSLLLPIVGISSAFAGLPFAGLEIKAITLILFALSIWELTPRVLGVCKLDKLYKLKMGRKILSISNNSLRNLRFITLSIIFTSLILVLPNIMPKDTKSGINQNSYFCEVKEN